MKSSDIPAKIVLPFANGAGASYIRSVPVGSQIGVVNGAASYTDGFPPDTFVPEAAGGYPPDGRDVNGLLNVISGWARWVAAAGLTYYDSTFSTSISGYPSGAVLIKADDRGLWISTIDDNTSDPDTGGAGWATLALSQSSADGRYAALAGKSTQQFSVANATGTTQAVALGQFASSIGANGWFKTPDANTPSGFRIEQYGLNPVVGAVDTLITFPIAFPNAVTNIQSTLITTGSGSGSSNNDIVSSVTNANFQMRSDASPVIGGYWRAIGY